MPPLLQTEEYEEEKEEEEEEEPVVDGGLFQGSADYKKLVSSLKRAVIPSGGYQMI
jgi:hypothetical protein